MECCGDLQLVSSSGVALCHPYALGRYRKIGVCGGRSFYQHTNNSDIFLYHACAAWYVGLEVGSRYNIMLISKSSMFATTDWLMRRLDAVQVAGPLRLQPKPPDPVAVLQQRAPGEGRHLQLR